MKYAALLQFALIVLVAACAGQSPHSALPSNGAAAGQPSLRRGSSTSPITHVIIILQENRTPDDLFQGMAAHGADIATQALDSEGQIVDLRRRSLATSFDLGHGHSSYTDDCDFQPSGVCKMDGFDKNLEHRYHMRPFSYAPQSEVQPYLDMAVQYVFADRMFQSNQAGSFPAHQYIVSGTADGLPVTSDNVSSDPFNSVTGAKVPAGCDAPAQAAVDTIDPANGYPGPTPFPCFDRPVLSDLLDQYGFTWRYYQRGLGAGLWHALDAVSHVRYGSDYKYVVTPPEKILTDITHKRLRNVSWVMPADGPHSDHAGNNSAAGPSWVAAIVNTLGSSIYWKHTAIFLTWDDWGGWYDHVSPPQMGNYYELGFRVPLVVISPYAKAGYVSHTQYEFGSILAFTEETFGIPKGALGTTDVRANDLMDAFDFAQTPRPYVQISAPPFVPAQSGTKGFAAEDP